MSRFINFHFIFQIISLIQFCVCSFIGDYYRNFSLLEYYVTSTNISFCYDVTKLEKAVKKFTCEIQFERNVRYKVSLQFKDIKLIDSKTNFLCEENVTQECTMFNEKHFDVVRGFIFSNQNSSLVTGYIKKYSFYGTVFIDNITYSVEDLTNYPQIYDEFKNLGKNAIIFKEDLLNLPLVQKYIGRESFLTKETVDLTKKTDREKFRHLIERGNICSLFVLMDYSFFKIIHKGDTRAAVAQILSSLEETNSIFRSTDFDGDGEPDNIGFYIKHFIMLQTQDTSMNLLPKYTSSEYNGVLYLRKFTYYTILKEVCLGVLFTGQTFDDNTLGVSYTPDSGTGLKLPLGGICNRPHTLMKGKILNALVVAPKLKNGQILSQLMFDYCVAHEFGHSFGSHHDTSRECQGYIMASHTPTDTERKRFIFSKCSKEMILKTIIRQGHCFESDKKQFCGNGIVEDEESCDCGTIRDCRDFDACCTPRGQHNSCGVNKNNLIDCHPSQGICCTLSCKYNNLSRADLDCRNFERKCPCHKSEPCKCGVGGECTKSVCSSEECTRISLSECDCPKNVARKKCQTCCLFNDSCLPSHIISEKIIPNNRSLINKLRNLKNSIAKNSAFGYLKKFCDDSFCVELYFRGGNPGEYCLLYGTVGICNKSFQCSIPKAKKIFPTLRVHYVHNCSKLFIPLGVYKFLSLLLVLTIFV